jgi:hypothetical protein
LTGSPRPARRPRPAPQGGHRWTSAFRGGTTSQPSASRSCRCPSLTGAGTPESRFPKPSPTSGVLGSSSSRSHKPFEVRDATRSDRPVYHHVRSPGASCRTPPAPTGDRPQTRRPVRPDLYGGKQDARSPAEGPTPHLSEVVGDWPASAPRQNADAGFEEPTTAATLKLGRRLHSRRRRRPAGRMAGSFSFPRCAAQGRER